MAGDGGCGQYLIIKYLRLFLILLLDLLSKGGIQMTETTENREVKSDVFSMLMEEKENALEVYNALNGSDYKDAGLIEAKTLEK